jgi:hypothetical protein
MNPFPRFKTASAFEGVLKVALKEKKIGVFEELSDDVGRFSYIETSTAWKGVFRNQVHDYETVHDILKLRKHRIASYRDEIPQHAQRVITAMPHELRRNAWVVSGFRILEDREFIRSRTELTALGRTAKSAQESVVSAGRQVGAFLNQHGKAIGIGAGILAAVTLAAVAAPAMLAIGAVQAVAADPAVVIEKYVFAGWE